MSDHVVFFFKQKTADEILALLEFRRVLFRSTNYVPNIGFVLGLVPPAILALLDGGWTDFWVVVAVYALLNFVVKTLIQRSEERRVGKSVDLGGRRIIQKQQQTSTNSDAY